MTYRILVTGSREWTDADAIYQAVRKAALRRATATVVHGGARGADLLAGSAARRLGLNEEVHPVQWTQDGRFTPNAGILRNVAMVKLGADVCLAFIKSGSRGASHCAGTAERAGIPVTRYVQ